MSNSDVIKALKNSGKGKLNYDRYWDNQSVQDRDVLDSERFQLISNKTINLKLDGDKKVEPSSAGSADSNDDKDSKINNTVDKANMVQDDGDALNEKVIDEKKQVNENVSDGDGGDAKARNGHDDHDSKISLPADEVKEDKVDLDIAVEGKKIEQSLTFYEKSRQEIVHERVAKQAKEVENFNKIIMEEAEEEMKLIRQKYLLSTLKRLKSHREECEALIEEINRRETANSTKQSGNSYNDKMKEIEARQKQLEQDRETKLDEERRQVISPARDEIEVIIKEIKDLMDNHASKFASKEQHAVKHQFNQALSLLNQMDMILTNNHISGHEFAAIMEKIKEVKGTKAYINTLIEELSSSTSTPAAAIDPLPKPTNASETDNDAKSTSKSIDNNSSSSDDGYGDLSDCAEKKIFAEYIKLQKFCCDFENSLQSFVNDAKYKSYRNELQLFIRTLINTISNGPVEPIRQKASQLKSLFSKKTVFFQDKNINVNSHPDALNFCFSFTAKTFISVGAKQVSSISKAAFPMGALIALIWSRFPVFGKLFLGFLQEKCPFVIPYYPKKEKDESEVNHLIACGYVFAKDGKTLESEESYINRMKALIMIFGAVIQTNISKGHPYSLRFGWRWLAATLNLQPRALVTAGVLQAFLLITSFKMYNYYGKQFYKILNYIESVYLPMIEKVTGKENKRQTLVQLELFVKESSQKIRSSRRIDEPDGYIRIIPENF